MEKSAYYLLIENLSKRGIDYESSHSERKTVLPGTGWTPSAKFVLAPIDSLYFFANDSFANTMQTSIISTGVYGIINLPPKAECMIYKKDWLDRFLRSGKVKTGNSYIDDRLTITSGSGWNASGLLTESNVKVFLEIAKRFLPTKMIIQPGYLSFIEALKGKTVIGIEANQWLYKKEDLDLMLGLGARLITSIQNK